MDPKSSRDLSMIGATGFNTLINPAVLGDPLASANKDADNSLGLITHITVPLDRCYREL